MKSFITKWFLETKLEVTLEESLRKRSPTLSLRCLGLERCPRLMESLPPNYVESIKCLHLQYNQFNFFPRTNCHFLKELKALTLDYNELTDLPFDFRHFKCLTLINVSHNKFLGDHFFFSICQIKTLKVLWANGTGLDDIPVEIGALGQLHTLGLRKNNIQKMPEELFELENLKWLSLERNQIQVVPYQVWKLKKIVHLNLSFNRIVSVPTSLALLQELRYLFLQHNYLILDEDFRSLILSIPKLAKCTIFGNLISSSSTSIEDLTEIVRSGEASNGMTPWSVSRPSSPTNLHAEVDDVDDTIDENNNIVGEVLDVEVIEVTTLHSRQDSFNNSSDNPNSSLEEIPDKVPSKAEEITKEIDETKEKDNFVTIFKKHSGFIKVPASIPPVNRSSRSSSEEHFISEDNNLAPPTDIKSAENGENSPEKNSSLMGHPETLKVENEDMEKADLPMKIDDINEHYDDKQDEVEKSAIPIRSSCIKRTEEWVMGLISQAGVELAYPEKSESDHKNNNSLKDLSLESQLFNEDAQLISSQSKPDLIESKESLENKSSMIFISSSNKNCDLELVATSQLAFHCRRTQSCVMISDKKSTSMISRVSKSNQEVLFFKQSFDENPQSFEEVELVGSSSGQINMMTSTGQSFARGSQEASVVNLLPDDYAFSSFVTASGSRYALGASAAGAESTDNVADAEDLTVEIDLDIQSNYDPSDWEFSTTSSLIDEEDILSRFVSFDNFSNGEELEDQFVPLEANDFLGILKRLISI